MILFHITLVTCFSLCFLWMPRFTMSSIDILFFPLQACFFMVSQRGTSSSNPFTNPINSSEKFEEFDGIFIVLIILVTYSLFATSVRMHKCISNPITTRYGMYTFSLMGLRVLLLITSLSKTFAPQQPFSCPCSTSGRSVLQSRHRIRRFALLYRNQMQIHLHFYTHGCERTR